MSKVIVSGESLVGQHINEWEVLGVVSTDKLLCRCSCGKIKEVYKTHLIHDKSFSCGCKRRSVINDKFVGSTFGKWTVIERITGSRYLCKCQCGVTKIQYKKNLVNGSTLSCGCDKVENRKNTLINTYGEIAQARLNNPRTQWQIDTASSEEALKRYIISLSESDRNLIFLSKELDLSMTHMYVLVKKYNLYELLNYKSTASQPELELRKFIQQVYDGEIIFNCRDILKPQEIDIYLPDIKIGIEYNGNYWHCSLNKPKKYHQDKTLNAYKNDVRLIHIFEYEWVNNKEKIMNYIENIIKADKKTLYARDTKVCLVDNDSEKVFENINHLQGYVPSEICVGLKYNNELVAIMSFGKDRFGRTNKTEILRLCFKQDTHIIGGTEKMFKHYIKDYYDNNGIISYCDISKFDGKSYLKLGFKSIKITDPGYIWVNRQNNVLSRHQTQKQKLINKGLGYENQTEDEIMYNNGYFKIYNCGNILFEH